MRTSLRVSEVAGRLPHWSSLSAVTFCDEHHVSRHLRECHRPYDDQELIGGVLGEEPEEARRAGF